MMEPKKCIYKPKSKNVWEHLRNCKGYATGPHYNYKSNKYHFKPNKDKFCGLNVYYVNYEDLLFLREE